MVGRERERAELAAAVQDARHGRGRAALLLGEAGMGKSMLARWLAAHAMTVGLRTAHGACSAAGMPPLWPWQRALDNVGVAIPWRVDGTTPTSSGRELVAAAVVEVIATVARRQPLLVVLEDLHWSDPVSLLVARAAADTVAALPVMLLFTCRDDRHELAPEIRHQLADLPTGVRRMRLPPLDLADVALLAAHSRGQMLSDQAVRDLHARTGGNPFFVHEVARLMAAHGSAASFVVPPGVREVLQRRVARLSQRCAAFVTAASVVAETCAEVIEDDLVCTVVGADKAEAARLLDEAVAARLLDVDLAAGARYRFRHALVWEVLAQDLSSAERGRLHALLAEALEDRAGEQMFAARLAYHWSRATGAEARDRAAVWSLLAARDAMAGFGFEAAALHYARALTDPNTDRIAVSIEYGEALQLSGDTTSARDVLLGAAREAAAAGRAVELAQAGLALGGGIAGFEVPIWDEDQADLLWEADALLPVGEVALRAAVRARLSLALAGTAALTERVRLAADAVRMAHAAGDRHVESAVLAAYCDAIAGPDHVAERVAAASRMLSLAADTPASSVRQHPAELLARRLLLVAYLEQGDFAAADEQAAAYERAARRTGIARYGWLPEIWRGMRALLVGNPDQALDHAAAAAEIGRNAASFNAGLMAFTVRMQAHLDRGTPEQFSGDINAVLAMVGPAGELVEAAGGPPATAAGADLGPVLDETARRAYRRRLAELEREVDDAEADADLGRVERLRTERSMIAEELAGALGLGGRPRIAGDPVERARKAVTMRIRAAIKTIAVQDEALARHLRTTVRTGRLCSYEPEPPVRWQS